MFMMQACTYHEQMLDQGEWADVTARPQALEPCVNANRYKIHVPEVCNAEAIGYRRFSPSCSHCCRAFLCTLMAVYTSTRLLAIGRLRAKAKSKVVGDIRLF